MMGVDPDRIRDIWTFEESTELSEAERAALRLARDGALVPNMVEPEHFEKLRAHYSDRHIVEMFAVISLAGWYNRWNNSIATVTDRESVEWAEAIFKAVGWELEDAGTSHEQRKKHPRSTDRTGLSIDLGDLGQAWRRIERRMTRRSCGRAAHLHVYAYQRMPG